MTRKAEPLAITRCPECRGPFPANQTECPYCGSENALIDQLPITAALPDHRSEALSKAMLLVLGLSILAMVLYIAPLHVLQSPGRKLAQLIAVTSLALAALGLKDASRLAQSPCGGSLNPVKWFAYLLLAWPLTLPLYFRVRKYLGQTDRSRAADAMALTSLIVMTGLVLLIGRREEQYRPSVLNQRVEIQQHHWPVRHDSPQSHPHSHAPGTAPHDHPHAAEDAPQVPHAPHSPGANHPHRM